MVVEFTNSRNVDGFIEFPLFSFIFFVILSLLDLLTGLLGVVDRSLTDARGFYSRFEVLSCTYKAFDFFKVF